MKTIKPKPIQHGDISLHLVKELPQGLKKLPKTDCFVLAEGEATGHRHRLLGDFDVYEDTEKNYWLDIKEATIAHFNSLTKEKAEHDVVVIPQSIRIVKRERRYNPFTEEIKKSQD